MKIEEVFRKLKPVAGLDMDRLWREYILSNTAGRKAIEDSLRLSLAKRLDQTFEEREVLLEPPPKDSANGEYPMGIVHYGKERFHPFGLREDEWVQHIGIFSRSGWGKTNIGFLIVANLIAKGKPFLVFDWKRNYRDILEAHPDREILVLTAGRPVARFAFNPLIPPEGTPRNSWLKKLITIAQHSLFLGEGVAYLMQEAISGAYQEFGCREKEPDTWPTIKDVKEWLQRYKVKGRQAQWMDSALRAVGVLCFGEMGEILNSHGGIPISELLERNAILELDGLSNTEKTFLIESLLLWIHHYRMGQSERETFKHALVIEEAHHILLRKKQEMSGEEAITDILLREIRELGESVILLDQHPSLISKPALGNTYTTIVGNLKHRSDISMIADSLLLDTKQARFIGKLEQGWAMVKLQGRWFEPFLVKFPLFRVRKGSVSDAEIQERMSGLIPPTDVREVTPDIPKGKEHDDEKSKPSEIEALLIQDVIRYQDSPVTERYERIGVNTYQGNKAKERLVTGGILYQRAIPTEKGRVLHLVASDKNLSQKSIANPGHQSKRLGGPAHERTKDQIGNRYKARGWRVIEEYPIGGGKTVDLACFKNGRKLAIEIETGNSYAGYNVKKCLKAGFDEVRTIRSR